MRPRETVASLLTPRGRGAIATIALVGPDAAGIVSALFATARGNVSLESGRASLGHWPLTAAKPGAWGRADHTAWCPSAPGPSIAREEVVVARIEPDHFEINSHGGDQVAAAILATLSEAGAQVVDWRELAAREAEDPIASEALAALAEAPTVRTAAILLDQYRGALWRAMERIAGLRNTDPAAARHEIGTLLSRAEIGRHLTRPWRVVLAGPPNVGKSTLLNALAGYQRAIVFDQPGTTRDVVTVRTALDGWPIELADTAGLRDAADALEAAGVERAVTELKSADLVVWLTDASSDQPQTPPPDAERVVVVGNKCDLPGGDDRCPVDARISALVGRGLGLLKQLIVARLVGTPPPPGAAVPFCERHIVALERFAGNPAAAN